MSSNSGTQRSFPEESSPEIALQNSSELKLETRAPLPALLRNVCYDFSTEYGYDIVTDIIVFNRNAKVKPTKISNLFDHTIEWKGDYGIVNFGYKWINMLWLSESEERINFDDYRGSITIYKKVLLLPNSERRMLAKNNTMLIDPIAIMTYPKRLLINETDEFNCLELGKNITELELELNGHSVLKLTRTGMNAYRLINDRYFRLSSHYLTQFQFPGHAMGRKHFTTVQLKETKCVKTTKKFN